MIAPELLRKLTYRYEALEAELSTSAGSSRFAQLSREYAELGPVITKIQAYQELVRQMTEAEQMAKSESDPELRALADSEWHDLKNQLPAAEEELRLALLPKDAADERSAILEVRAGTGGDEAALFAADLWRMYQRHAALQGWQLEILDISETGIGGFKEASMLIKGEGVFAQLKFESGVHRVQRVPVTEASGRIHTSAATVAVLPEAGEVDVVIEDKDLRIDTYRSQGAGGQHVNTTDSAVRITHLPTGIVSACQDEKSQHKNKAKAMKLLRAKLFDAERQAQDQARAADRRDQVGSGDRSERIRTYNFPQNRVTDHRIDLTLYSLDRVVAGDALNDLIAALVQHDRARKLAAQDEGL